MSKELSNSIAAMVREHRKQAQLTQIQLADLAGVGKASIWDIEHGKETVQLNTLCRVLSVLNIEIKFESPLTLPHEGQKP